MKKNLLAILRMLAFVPFLSFCFVSCEVFGLESGGDDETEGEYDTEISPLYLSEMAQQEASYYNGLLTLSMKVLTAYRSEEDRVVLSYYDEYGVYVQRSSQTEKLYSSKANMSNEYHINLDFKKSDMNIETVGFKATPKESIKFGVYTKDGYGIVKYYDGQVPEISYSDVPEALTGEVVSVGSTEATVKCSFDNCLFWEALRGVEYSMGSGSESILLETNEEDGMHEFHLTELKPDTTYNYRAYYEMNGVREYGEAKSFKTKGSICAVDLGLSVKWACCNVGADSPEDYGGYYAWGETEEKSDYTASTYKYEGQYISYNISGTSYDVASVKWGDGWRMPTKDEMNELCNNCSWEWTTVNGVRGCKVTGPNGNNIFLPAAGFRYGMDVDDRGVGGYYGSGTFYEILSYGMCCLYFNSVNQDWYHYRRRSDGLPVRPVKK